MKPCPSTSHLSIQNYCSPGVGILNHRCSGCEHQGEFVLLAFLFLLRRGALVRTLRCLRISAIFVEDIEEKMDNGTIRSCRSGKKNNTRGARSLHEDGDDLDIDSFQEFIHSG